MKIEAFNYILSQLFQVVGVFGLLASTLLFPFMALIIYSFRKKSLSQYVEKAQKLKIIIPAAPASTAALHRTLQSLKAAVELSPPQLTVDIEIASDEELQGKWRVISERVLSTSQSDNTEWVAFVDVGTLWPKDFLMKIYPLLHRDELVALFPSYRTSHRSFMSEIYWFFESALKSIESLAGGPTSSHGATALYRTQALQDVFISLRGKQYRNDDVVLPLMISSLYHDRRTLYLPHIKVFDSDISTTTMARDRRLVIGNIEWIRDLLPEVILRSPLVGIISLRRVFRLFWGYWLVSLYLSATLLVPYPFFIVTIVALLAVLSHSTVQRWWCSLCSSLESPLWFVSPWEESEWS